MWNLFQRSYKRENFLHFVFVCPVVLKKNKNKNLTASQRSRWRFVILSLPSSLSCRVYDSALFWSWGSDRGPDTIYLMLVTHTHSGTVCPARLLYYFNVYRLVHRALYLSLVSSKKIWEFISLLFLGEGNSLLRAPFLYAIMYHHVKSFPTNVVHFSSTLFLLFFLLRGVSGRVVTWLIGWRLNLMDASRGWNITCCPLWRPPKRHRVLASRRRWP